MRNFFELVCEFWHKSPYFCLNILTPQNVQAYLVFFLLQPSNHQPLLQGALIPFTGERCLKTNISHVGVCIAIVVPTARRPSSVDRARKLYILTNACVYIYWFVCLYILKNIQVYTDISDFNLIPQDSFQFFLICDFFLQQWETWLLLSTMYLPTF